jgi:hypothetical protein
MFEKYIILGILVLGLFLYSIYLFFQNISSEQIFASAITSLGIGSIAFIALVISTWEKNEYKIKFPVVIHYEAQNLHPFTVYPNLKDSNTFPRAPYEFSASYFMQELNKSSDIPPVKSDFIAWHRYHELVFYEVISTLFRRFNYDWDIEVIDSLITENGRNESYTAGRDKYKDKGETKLNRIYSRELPIIFPKSYAFSLLDKYSDSDTKGRPLTLPPKTKFIPLEYNESIKSFALENDFSKTIISVRKKLDDSGLQKLARILKISKKDSDRYRSAYYFVEIESKIFASKSNNLDIDKYKRWIANIESSLRQQLDYDIYLQRVLEWKEFES